MVSDTKKASTINQTVAEALAKRPQALFENSIIGAISTNGVYVYVVEDFELPPDTFQKLERFGYSMEITNAVGASKLQAFELATGKLKWEVGGPPSENGEIELPNSHFLGAPLVLGDKLYVAVESNGAHAEREVRLAILDPRTGKVLAEKLLLTHNEPLMPGTRRLHAVQLVQGDGALICCANTGTVVAFDLITERLRWLVRYRENLENGAALDADSSWVATAPVISGENVILGAADSTAIHCLNLRDGVRVWSAPHRRDDVYLAGVFQGKVLIISQEHIRALTLERGDWVWGFNTGTISGFGVAAGRRLLSPDQGQAGHLRRSISRTRHRTDLRRKDAPGNLLLFDGYLLSLTPRTMTAYPQTMTHLKTLDETLLEDAERPRGARRQARPTLHLFRGDVTQSSRHRRGACAENSNRMSRNGRHSASNCSRRLQTLFTTTPPSRPALLKEFADTIIVDFDVDAMSVTRSDTMRPRQLHFLMTIALSHEKTRHFGEAARCYLAAFKAADANEMLSLPQTPETQIRVGNMWARTRLEDTAAEAVTPEPRLVDQGRNQEA